MVTAEAILVQTSKCTWLYKVLEYEGFAVRLMRAKRLARSYQISVPSRVADKHTRELDTLTDVLISPRTSLFFQYCLCWVTTRMEARTSIDWACIELPPFSFHREVLGQ